MNKSIAIDVVKALIHKLDGMEKETVQFMLKDFESNDVNQKTGE